MHIELLSHRDIQGTDLRDALERRAERLLARVQEQIAELSVSLIDLNGPKGGVDSQCQAQAKLRDGQLVVVRARSEHFGKAIDDAMQKLAKRILRLRKKTVEKRRSAVSFGRIAAAD